MPELSHDAAEDGFHEIQLSGKQLVFLFIVTTTVLVVVFLCGVKVGRGARAIAGEEPETGAPAATAPSPQPQPQAVADAGPPAAEPPAPATDTPEELSYHKRLQGDSAPAETLKPAEDRKPTTQPSASAPSKDAGATARQTPAASAQQGAAGAPSSGRPGTWVVQVIATRDRDIASSVVKKLAGKGYPAFLVNPAAGAAQPFYKVHVGRYSDRAEATQVSDRIKKEEQFQAWITR